MHNSRWTIPGCSQVPFHIGIVSKELAIGIEVHVVGVSITHAKHFPGFSVRIGLSNPPARCQFAPGVTSRIPLTWQEMVFAPIAG